MDLKIKQTIAVLTVVLLAVGCLVPIINESVRQHDADTLAAPVGAYEVGDLDGWGMDLSKASTGYTVQSSMYTGTVRTAGMLLSSSAVTVWTDTDRVYTMVGGTVTAGTSLSVSIEGETMTVNDTPVTVTGTVYVPDEFGALGSYAGQTHGLPMAGIGSYAGVTVGSIADELTGNSSDYVLDVSVTEDGDRYGVEYVPGEYEAPVQVPPRQQAQIKPGLDLDVIENEEFGTIEKGEITIIPGKGEIIGDIDMEDVIVTPGKLPSDIQAVGDATSGTTGQCTWELDGTVLYIQGTGATANYVVSGADNPPWGADITAAYVDEGVTSLGDGLFYNCKSLTEVYLPTSLLTIRSYAFNGCTSLVSVDLPDHITSMAYRTFRGCTALSSLICPESLTSFGQNAIEGCTALRELFISPATPTISSQLGWTFIGSDGTAIGSIPPSGLSLGYSPYQMYQTVTETVGDETYRLNADRAELMVAKNAETVHIPYSVTYDGTDYIVKTIADGAVSGSAVRYVVIPQTVESISPTAITGPGIKEVLNLSATEVTASHGEVRTSVPALAVIAEPVTAKGFGATASVLGIVPLILVAGAVLAIVRGFARARYD